MHFVCEYRKLGPRELLYFENSTFRGGNNGWPSFRRFIREQSRVRRRDSRSRAFRNDAKNAPFSTGQRFNKLVQVLPLVNAL